MARNDIIKNVAFNGEDIYMMDQLNRLKAFVNLYQAGTREVESRLLTLSEEFETKFQHNPIQHMQSRVKSIQSIANKLLKKGVDVSTDNAKKYLSDVGGVRVVCCYIEDVYEVAKFLVRQDDLQLVDRKDYIKNPKENGYRSLHLVFNVPIFLSTGPQEVLIEVQIRSMAMDFWASLEHDIRYKTMLADQPELFDKLKKIAVKAHELDLEMQKIYYETITNHILNGE